MIYTAPCFSCKQHPLRGQFGGCWALEIDSFLGPVKWHRADMRVPFGAIFPSLIGEYLTILFLLFHYYFTFSRYIISDTLLRF
jgi:hypothetical protein